MSGESYPAYEGVEEELFRRVAMFRGVELQLALLGRAEAHAQEVGALGREAGWDAWRGNARLPHHLEGGVKLSFPGL